MKAIIKNVRRWWLRYQLENTQRHIEHIQKQREHDRHVERILTRDSVVLRSQLRSLTGE